MKTTSHGAFLTQLTQFPVAFPINFYLVHEDDGLTLIDNGLFGNTKGILAAAAKIGAPIPRLALTHAHGDHIGSLVALHAALPQAEIIVSARDARILAGDRSPQPGEPADAKLRGTFKTLDLKPTRLLQPGDTVGSLQVVAAPGHTPGHIAFFDPRDGTLIVGDAFQTRGGVAVSGVIRPTFPFPAFATWHKPTALQTAQSLRALNPTRLAVGHGDVLDSPLPAMDAAIATAQKRFQP